MLMTLYPCALMENVNENQESMQLDTQLLLGDSLVEMLQVVIPDQDVMDALQAVIENLRVSVQADENQAYTQVFLKDRLLLDGHVKQADGEAYITTSLLPGMALRVPSLEKEQADVQQLAEKLKQDLTAWLGEGEMGEYLMESVTDVPYDTHYALNLEDEELVRILEEFVQGLIPEDEVGFATVSADVFVTDTQEQCDLYTRKDGAFLLTAFSAESDVRDEIVFAGENGEYVFSWLAGQSAQNTLMENLDAAMENGFEEGVFLSAGEEGDNFHLAGVMYADGGEVSLQYSQEKLLEELYGSLTAEVYVEDVYVGFAGEFRAGDTTDAAFTVRFPENETLFTWKMTGGEAKAAIPEMVYDELVDVETMTAQQEEALTTHLGMSAVTLLIQASAAMPDEMAKLASYLILMQQEPSSLGVIGGADGPTAVWITDEVNLGEGEASEDSMQVTVSQKLSINGDAPAAPAESTEEAAPEATPTPRPLFGQ